MEANKRYLGLFWLVSLFFALALGGCTYIEEELGGYRGDGGEPAPPDYSGSQELPDQKYVRRLPWELWPYDRDLEGQPLKGYLLLQGDQALREGKLDLALQSYRRAWTAARTAIERDAAAVRVASTELAANNPREALTTLSDHARSQSRVPDEVDARFSIIFAYAYGAIGDVEQSLAWFSRVNRLGGARGGMQAASEQGVRLLLRSLPSERFEQIGSEWSTDAFVSRLLGQENVRRARRDFKEPEGVWRDRGFWETEGDAVPVITAAERSAGQVVVGVLLPLSGRFSRFGVSMRRGIELAMEAHPDLNVRLEFRDTAGDSLEASARARELITAQNAVVLLGPLLSEAALPVADIARRSGVVQLTFSKREFFPTGAGVFRLGPTVSSQIRSLLDVSYGELGLLRYALVYPQSSQGEEHGRIFKDEVAARGLDLVFEGTYPEGDNAALVSIAKALDEYRFDALLLPDRLPVASQLFVNLSRKHARSVPLGVATWNDSAQLKRAGSAMQGAVFVSPFFIDSQNQIVDQFNRSYSSRYGVRPDFLAAQAFDAGTLICAALGRYLQDGVPIATALHAVQSYGGLTGSIVVEPSGEMNRRFVVAELRGGRVREIVGQPAPELAGQKRSRSFALPSEKVKRGVDNMGTDAGGLPGTLGEARRSVYSQ